ncbi:hypothetical protein [Methylobacterium platani]|uniref:Uncharacterized protein n=1 Tax=Methylobacterium platani TaxID=427683 RepID=A0A179SDW1_9HYPH|nr:hypothetical protein [Methylobacterium platani]OAS26053.1 hypothetical protein A5481_06760 [Methylobacterium platani]
MSQTRPDPRTRDYVLYRSDSRGPDLSDVAEQVRAMAEVTLIRQGDTGLLVQGGAQAIKKLTLGLEGWSAEENKRVRTAG